MSVSSGEAMTGRHRLVLTVSEEVGGFSLAQLENVVAGVNGGVETLLVIPALSCTVAGEELTELHELGTTTGGWSMSTWLQWLRMSSGKVSRWFS